MNNSDNFSVGSISIDSIRIKWGWFVGLGLTTLILGVLAFGNLMLATTITVYYVGALMTLGGLLQIIHAFQVRTWSGFFFFLVSGALYGAAGILAIQNPLFAAATLTLVLSISLVAAGTIRIWSSMQLKSQDGWNWILFSGIITTLAGLIFLLDWPVNSVWLMGMVLAADLCFQGVATVMFGMNLNNSKSTVKIHAKDALLYP